MSIEVLTRPVVGEGSPDSELSSSTLTAIVAQALESIRPGERVLAIVPDKTRDDNTDLLLPFAAEVLTRRSVARFDALIAQGTHPPMTKDQKALKLGIGNESSDDFSGSRFDPR